MLFGWLIPNTVATSNNTESLSSIDKHYLLDQKFKSSRSNLTKLYSRLIDKSSGKNMVKIKSLLDEFQRETLERRHCRLEMIDSDINTTLCAQIDCLESEILEFAHKWISVPKRDFEFMNFLVDLERIGDSLRLLFKSEDTEISHFQLAAAS